MATLIPAFGNCSPRMTNGERRLAQRLEEKLENDYLLWFDVSIGPKRLHPDCIVLHPSRGLFILEVKDWTLNTIKKVSPTTILCLIGNDLKEFKHPLQQARDYALAVVKLLRRDQLLVQSGGHQQGQLAFPYSYSTFPVCRVHWKSAVSRNGIPPTPTAPTRSISGFCTHSAIILHLVTGIYTRKWVPWLEPSTRATMAIF
jgi:hypothetical protein